MSSETGAEQDNGLADKPKRRWYQFSLRTLLIFVLLLSIGLSWLGVTLRRMREQREAARRQQEAIQAIRDLGGEADVVVKSDGASYAIANFVRPPLADKHIPHLEELASHHDRLNITIWCLPPDEKRGHGQLKELVGVRQLGLKLTLATDADLEHLTGLANLHTLCLCGGEVTDAGLDHLQGLVNLEVLGLLDVREATGAGLKHLKDSTRLRQIYVVNSAGTSKREGFTDAGLEHLKGMAGLEVLDLSWTLVTDTGLKHLKGLSGLEVLVLKGTQITDAGLEHLAGLTNLEALDLDWTQVTEDGLKHLKGLTGLRLLNARLDLNKAHQTLPGVAISYSSDLFWAEYNLWRARQAESEGRRKPPGEKSPADMYGDLLELVGASMEADRGPGQFLTNFY